MMEKDGKVRLWQDRVTRDKKSGGRENSESKNDREEQIRFKDETETENEIEQTEEQKLVKLSHWVSDLDL